MSKKANSLNIKPLTLESLVSSEFPKFDPMVIPKKDNLVVLVRREVVQEVVYAPKEFVDGLVNDEVVAVFLSINSRQVRRLRVERQLPYYKIGNLIRFKPSEVKGWVKKQKHIDI